MKYTKAITSLLTILVIFTVNTVQAIVIRHDVDDMQYQQLAKQYQHSITYNDGCVGTVIDYMWVLTAAHCITPEEQRPFILEHLGKKYPVEFIKIHPKFDPATNGYDMALLRVKWPMQQSQPALLYPLSDEVGKQVTFVGNGNFGNGITGITHTKATLRAATNIITKVNKNEISFIFDHPENALDLEGISGPHDSGGPAFIEKNAKLYVAGVSSWQSNQGKEGVYGVIEHYARVSTMRQWVKDTIKNTIKGNLTPPYMQHPLLQTVQTRSFDDIPKQVTLNPTWKNSPALVREILLEVAFNLSPKEAKEVINKIPELTTLKLNNISLPIYAIEQENWPLFTTLVELKINVNEKNTYGESYLTQLLMLYPVELSLKPLLKKLLAEGLDINTRDERGNTALALAVYLANRDNNTERVKLLLESGANPNIGDLEHYTPIMFIASVGNAELMSLFIKHGAKVNLKDKAGKTALDYAKENQHTAIIELINSQKLIP